MSQGPIRAALVVHLASAGAAFTPALRAGFALQTLVFPSRRGSYEGLVKDHEFSPSRNSQAAPSGRPNHRSFPARVAERT
jgi:hypothetical protein